MKVQMRLIRILICILAGYLIYLINTHEVKQTVETHEAEIITGTIRQIEVKELQKNRWDIEMTDEEIDMLAKILYLEAHCEPDDGMLAVVEVIFNRMISDEFPDTLEEVLGQSDPVQFSSWKNIHLAEPTAKEYRIILTALNGEREILTNDYMYFGRSKQNNYDPVLIGEHWFCKC